MVTVGLPSISNFIEPEMTSPDRPAGRLASQGDNVMDGPPAARTWGTPGPTATTVSSRTTRPTACRHLRPPLQQRPLMATSRSTGDWLLDERRRLRFA